MKGGYYMPNLDGTGPWGLGHMTGRALGRCARGFGYGARGYGRWGGAYYPPVTSFRNDKTFLEERREYLKDELNYIERILKETDDTEKKEE